jgi:CheY-specific phosphatase CheX
MAMDQTATDLITSAFRDVLAESGFTSPVVETAPPDGIGTHDLLCSVGLAGGLSGFLLLGFSSAGLERLTKRMAAHSGLTAEEDHTQLQREAAAELTNQMAGRAVNALARRGLDCMITPPTLVAGHALRASLPNLDDRTLWKAVAGDADFDISLHIRKK